MNDNSLVSFHSGGGGGVQNGDCLGPLKTNGTGGSAPCPAPAMSLADARSSSPNHSVDMCSTSGGGSLSVIHHGNDLGSMQLALPVFQHQQQLHNTAPELVYQACNPTHHASPPLMPPPSASVDSELSTTNVFVSHLPTSMNDDTLRNIFAPFGTIVSSVIMRDIYSGASRGIAFVEYFDERAAQAAIRCMDKAMVGDKVITVQRAKKFERGAPTERVFVRNIPQAVTEGEFGSYLARFGRVVSLTMHADSMRTSTNPWGPMPLAAPERMSACPATVGPSLLTGEGGEGDGGPTLGTKSPEVRTIAFVTFSTVAEAAAAATALHNDTPFDGCNGVPLLTKVVVDNLPSKKVRRAQQQQQHQQSTHAVHHHHHHHHHYHHHHHLHQRRDRQLGSSPPLHQECVHQHQQIIPSAVMMAAPQFHPLEHRAYAPVYASSPPPQPQQHLPLAYGAIPAYPLQQHLPMGLVQQPHLLDGHTAAPYGGYGGIPMPTPVHGNGAMLVHQQQASGVGSSQIFHTHSMPYFTPPGHPHPHGVSPLPQHQQPLQPFQPHYYYGLPQQQGEVPIAFSSNGVQASTTYVWPHS